MERDTTQQDLVELGAASEQTLGANGRYFDLVGEIEPTGISED